ncbi:MAG: SH3 domain-containing protein, partial [Verrucomicrobiota bacterium]
MKTTHVVIASLIAIMPPLSHAGRKLQTQYEKVIVRSAPQPFGKKQFTLTYEDKVEELEAKGSWLKIKDLKTQQTGWAPGKSFKKSSLAFSSSTAGVGSATATEVAAAGKGFSAEVEQGMKEKNAALNFAAVDRMEATVVDEDAMLSFL